MKKEYENENKENNINNLRLERLRGDGGFSNKWSDRTESGFRGYPCGVLKESKLVHLSKQRELLEFTV